MKKHFIATALLAASFSISAAPQAPAKDPMADALGLTPEQVEKINRIKADYQQKLQAIIKEGEEKIQAVLTPEQKQKLAELQAQREAMMRKMREMMQQRQQQHGQPQTSDN